MSSPSTPLSRAPQRILIAADAVAMTDSYRRSLAVTQATTDDAWNNEVAREPVFALTHTHRVVDAIAEVERGLADGAPFAIAFIDNDLLAGIGARETAGLVRAIDPDINLVIVTDRSDTAAIEIGCLIEPTDKIFAMTKPFEGAAIRQAATTLVARWQKDRALAADHMKLARRVEQLEVQLAEAAANESRAVHISLHDPLTEAPNRLAFVRALAERVKRPGLFATAMVDLDRFKVVNDTLGHLAGDALLQAIYAMLHAAAPEQALIARLGGDEFGVLFDTPSEAAAATACDRLVAACSDTISVFGHAVQGGCSAGLLVCEGEEGRDPIDVVRRADLALNGAKRAGRGVVRLFDEGMDEGIRSRRRIENGLSEAIGRGELSLVYQPIVSRDRIEIEGFEALLRWNTQDYGPISPAVFIPIAEESNLIHELGDWVLQAALDEVRRWPGHYVSVNFSPRQFRRHDFAGHMIASLTRAGIAPQRVQIEITESAIFDNAERAADTLARLRQVGFRIALDDFGTGYSSLYNIRKFALDCLKIDRSFIDGMGRERESAAIVHSIIHLGRALGLGVIAEGVETEAQVQALRIAGASHLQGFFFSRPVAAEIARAMATGRFLAFDDQPTRALGSGTRG